MGIWELLLVIFLLQPKLFIDDFRFLSLFRPIPCSNCSSFETTFLSLFRSSLKYPWNFLSRRKKKQCISVNERHSTARAFQVMLRGNRFVRTLA